MDWKDSTAGMVFTLHKAYPVWPLDHLCPLNLPRVIIKCSHSFVSQVWSPKDTNKKLFLSCQYTVLQCWHARVSHIQHSNLTFTLPCVQSVHFPSPLCQSSSPPHIPSQHPSPISHWHDKFISINQLLDSDTLGHFIISCFCTFHIWKGSFCISPGWTVSD